MDERERYALDVQGERDAREPLDARERERYPLDAHERERDELERELDALMAEIAAEKAAKGAAAPAAADTAASAVATDAPGAASGAHPRREVLLAGLWRENPLLRLGLGLCPALAVTATAPGGLSMGLAAAFVLVCANVTSALFGRLIPQRLRTSACLIITAGFTTLAELLTRLWFPDIYTLLGVYLPLTAVSCLLLGRAETFARRGGVADAALDGVGMGVGFTAALLLLGMVRELLGGGTLFGWETGLPAIGFFALPAGGFFVCGVCLWLAGRLGALTAGRSASAAAEGDSGGEEGAGCAGCLLADSCRELQMADGCRELQLAGGGRELQLASGTAGKGAAGDA